MPDPILACQSGRSMSPSWIAMILLAADIEMQDVGPKRPVRQHLIPSIVPSLALGFHDHLTRG